MKVKNKTKLELIATIMLSVFIVGSAGVTTFAWFKASAASVIASGSSVEITVSAPDTFELGNATIYAYDNNGSYGYVGDIASGSKITNNDVANFTEVTDSNKSTKLVVDKLAPGRKMSFGIKIQTPHAITATSLNLQKYKAKNNTYRKTLTSLDSEGNESGTAGTPSGSIVFIEDVINLYGAANSTGIFALGTAKNLASDLKCSKTYDNNVYGYTESDFSGIDYEIMKNNSLSVSANGYIYLFYTIEFSNSNLYVEYTYDESSKKYYPCHTVIAHNYAGNRYFFPDDTDGNSSCYSGCVFTLEKLNVTVSEYAI